MYTYYHNPRCQKSREGLELLKKLKVEFKVIEYLKEKLNEKDLLNLFEKVKDDPNFYVRLKDPKVNDLNIDLSLMTAKKWAKVLKDHPEFLERPILETDKEAIIGRPAQRLEEFLKNRS